MFPLRVVRATPGSLKRAINQHRQGYPMATVRMSSMEVLHEMFIVSSDPLLGLVTKSHAGACRQIDLAELAWRHPTFPGPTH